MVGKIDKKGPIAVIGAGALAAGAVVMYVLRWRAAKASTIQSLVRDVDDMKRAIAQLESLAADEAQVYLTGWMRGRQDACESKDCKNPE